MAIEFDGTDDQASYSHFAGLDGVSQFTIFLRVYPIANDFYNSFLSQMGASSGSGNTHGVSILNDASATTGLFVGVRNGASDPQKIKENVLTPNAWNALVVWFDGSLAASSRIGASVDGTVISSWSAEPATPPTTVGTTDVPLTLGAENGSLHNNCRIADPVIMPGRVMNDQAILTAHANGYSGGHFVRSGDFWAPLIRNANDVFGRTATLTGTTVADHPRIILVRPSAVASRSAGSSGLTITPGAAQLSLSASAPARLLQHLAAPAAAALLLSATAPTVSIATEVSPAAAQLALSTTTPVALQEHRPAPTSAQLALSGSAPTRLVSHLLEPAAGQLTLTTVAPSLGNEINISPDVAQLTLSTTAPTRLVAHLLTPASGDLTLAGVAPSVVQDHRPAPAAASVALSATSPSVTIDHRPAVGAGALVLTSLAPTVTQAHLASPAAGQLVLSGVAPTIGTPVVYEFVEWTNVTVTCASLTNVTVRAASFTNVTVEPTP